MKTPLLEEKESISLGHVTLPGREGKRIPWSLDFTWKRRKAYLLVT
jgi:hypothetical protein